MTIVKFDYCNHKGVCRKRTVDVTSIDFHSKPGFGYEPGWFLTGIDQDKRQVRSFAVCNIVIETGSNNIFRLSL